jgi:hypothetical protein
MNRQRDFAPDLDDMKAMRCADGGRVRGPRVKSA